MSDDIMNEYVLLRRFYERAANGAIEDAQRDREYAATVLVESRNAVSAEVAQLLRVMSGVAKERAKSSEEMAQLYRDLVIAIHHADQGRQQKRPPKLDPSNVSCRYSIGEI